METNIHQLVSAIHDCPTRIILVTAGAGTQALSDLLGVAGATRTLLEAIVPYSEAAFDEFLGQKPAQYVVANTARLLAGRAFTRARWLESEPAPVIGMACTATIITDRPKRGQHRAHIAIWQPEQLTWYGLHLKKGARNRAGEENLVSRVMLNGLAKACNIPMTLDTTLIDGDELEIEVIDYAQMATKLHLCEVSYFGIEDNGRISPHRPTPKAILSGAFNPLHNGHLKMARAAAEILGHPITFELSAVNVDKPPLPLETILNRMSQFAGRWPIVASNAPTFIEKVRLFPGATFVVGYDTAVRILHPRYYNDNQENLISALSEIRESGSNFLVAGRVDKNGTFRHLNDLNIPPSFTDLFQPIPDRQFRKDISSTYLRQTGQRGSR